MIKLALKWLSGIVLVIAAIQSLQNSPVAAMFFLLTGLFLMPPILTALQRLINVTIKTPIKYIIVIAGILLAAVTSNPAETQTAPNAEVPDSQLSKSFPVATYRIEQSKFERGKFKAVFDVRIDNRMSEDQIKTTVNQIMSEYPGYTKYFIFYWMHDMDIGKESAWAISHYNASDDGHLQITIQGASDEEETIMKTTAIPKGEIIGRWFDNSAYSENVITIFKENNQLKLRQVYSDGSFGDKNLKLQGGKYTYPNDFGEYLKIEDTGDLGWYDENGIAIVAKNIQQ